MKDMVERIKNLSQTLLEENNDVRLKKILDILKFFYYNSIVRIEEYNSQIIQQLIPFLFFEE